MGTGRSSPHVSANGGTGFPADRNVVTASTAGWFSLVHALQLTTYSLTLISKCFFPVYLFYRFHSPWISTAYFSGKMLAKMGRIALIAEEMGRLDDARTVAARLAEASQVNTRSYLCWFRNRRRLPLSTRNIFALHTFFHQQHLILMPRGEFPRLSVAKASMYHQS